jgi:hypothetical protein
MGRYLWHFLSLVGDVGIDASFELGRFRAIVTDPNDRDELGDFPKFSRFCQRLLSTRFEPPAIHYSCVHNDYIGTPGIRRIAGNDYRLNAVIDLNWAATVFSDREAERVISFIQKVIDDDAGKNGPHYGCFIEKMLMVPLGHALIWDVPCTTFVVTQCVGMSAVDTEAIEASKATLDELVERAAQTAQYLPATQRGFQEPENS